MFGYITKYRMQKAPLKLATALALGLSLFVYSPENISTPAHAQSSVKKCAAANFLDKAGKRVLKAADKGSFNAFLNIVDSYADIPYMSRSALGKYRKQFPKEKTREYQRLTAGYMASTMAYYKKQFRGKELKILRCHGNKTITVNAKLIRTEAFQSDVILRLRRKGNTFKITDINIQQIWMVKLMRGQYGSQLRKTKGDFDHLFEYIKKNT